MKNALVGRATYINGDVQDFTDAHLWNSGADWSVSTEEELFGQTQKVEMALG